MLRLAYLIVLRIEVDMNMFRYELIYQQASGEPEISDGDPIRSLPRSLQGGLLVQCRWDRRVSSWPLIPMLA